jgi:hypothetical protein
MAVFWVFAPCNLADVSNAAVVLAATVLRATATSANFYQNTGLSNPEDSHLFHSPQLEPEIS